MHVKSRVQQYEFDVTDSGLDQTEELTLTRRDGSEDKEGGVSIDIEATSTSSQEGEFDLKENGEKKFSTRGNHTVKGKIVTTT
jgi:hypothetical protein